MKLLEQAGVYFSADYAEAQAKFYQACAERGLTYSDYIHPQHGPSGETLAASVARLGPLDASNLLLVISGTHGLEGLAGSGGQLAWLDQRDGRALPDDTAVLLVHLLNPWGCAWGRRQTEDNVDLNRNFQDFSGPLPTNTLYEDIHELVVGGECASRARDDARLIETRARLGEAGFATALFTGQYHFPDGVGFGGAEASWSQQTLGRIIDQYARSARKTAVIDIHTGLGPYGYGVILAAEPRASEAFSRMQRWYGPGVIAVNDDPDAPYKLEGDLLRWIVKRLPNSTAMSVEFGTFEVVKLLDLQIDDCRRHRRGDFSSPAARSIRAELREFFYPATLDWLQSVAFRCVQTIEMGLAGLGQGDSYDRMVAANAHE